MHRYFDENETFGYARQEQRERARRVIAHLETLGAEEVVRESVEFYKWIVMFPTSECNIHYAEALAHETCPDVPQRSIKVAKRKSSRVNHLR
eukprot:COSAG05_NODE_3032_length_2402_cov_10.783326_2_plen_92_part_00